MRIELMAALVSLCIAMPALAQKTDLLCDGTFSDFETPSGPRDVPVSGSVLRVDLGASTIEAWGGIGGLTGRHRIIERTEFAIRFVTSEGFLGFINRWNGAFNLVSSNDKKMNWLLSGACKPAKPIL